MYFRFDGKILDGIPLVARECGTWEGTCLREVGGGGGGVWLHLISPVCHQVPWKVAEEEAEQHKTSFSASSLQELALHTL